MQTHIPSNGISEFELRNGAFDDDYLMMMMMIISALDLKKLKVAKANQSDENGR